ncbi:MAG: tetratricopeptide repeat protein [Candidatus Hydrogenedentes bacterium]|nr:tetratricopeptide repeat protein [Candidatus Hydrogenedentota bacterium]
MATLKEGLRTGFLFDRGVRFAELENYTEALTFFEAVTIRDPNSAVAHSNVGYCHFKLGKAEAAVAAYSKARELDQSDPQIPYDLGCVFYAQGQKQQAYEAFREALDRMPSDKEAYSAMEKVRIELKLPATQGFSVPVTLPGSGRLVIEKSPRREAVAEETVSPVAAREPEPKAAPPVKPAKPAPATPAAPAAPAKPAKSVEEWLEEGNEHYSEGRFEEALRAWTEATRAQPGHAKAHNNRAAALLELGKHQEAIEAASEALRIHPGYAVAHMTRGEVYAALGNREAVLREYTALNQLDEDLAKHLLELIEKPSEGKS